MLTKEILCAYAPYGVEAQYRLSSVVGLQKRCKDELRDKEVTLDNLPFIMNYCKLYLRPLSSLTKPITYNGETFVFTELFEIGDDCGFIYDFRNGNTKLINNLESIAKYNCYHDINYLPYPVVKLMYEYHFDVHGLIESGHAIELKEVAW